MKFQTRRNHLRRRLPKTRVARLGILNGTKSEARVKSQYRGVRSPRTRGFGEEPRTKPQRQKVFRVFLLAVKAAAKEAPRARGPRARQNFSKMPKKNSLATPHLLTSTLHARAQAMRLYKKNQ